MTEDPLLPRAPWRRPMFVSTGLALIGVGAWINADRIGLVDEPPLQVDEGEVVAAVPRSAEGKMGRPSPPSKSGLYAMKGPKDAIPQMARNFDPDMMARNAGILGMVQEESGHFLASPYGGSFAVGSDDEDVWGGLEGTEIGEAFGVGGLGLVGTGRGGAEQYADVEPAPLVETRVDARSTFSIDVDTASYSNARRWIMRDGALPLPEAVRTEEFVNYFDYDYPQPEGDVPFSVTTEVGPAPWNREHRLVHIGVQGEILDADRIPPRNLVFLVDVSGSMMEPDKLPLVQYGLSALAEQLGPNDWISIVVYAGAAGAVLPPTRGDQTKAIIDALEGLQGGGSTNGAEGIRLAYDLARQHFIRGAVNRVILATDGDFNVGPSSTEALVEMIETERRSGVFLSVLGVGEGDLNDAMMEQIADKGNGNYAYIDGALEARKVLVEEASATLDTIAKDMKVQVGFDPARVRSHRLVGYENRTLQHRDFEDDTKDAGEIGAGHSVTALYEIELVEGACDGPIASLDLRYQRPDGGPSREVSFSVQDDGRELGDASDDFRFSSAVAAFAQKLRRAPDESEMEYAEIVDLAAGALAADRHCYRHAFLDLVLAAARLSKEEIPDPPTTACTPVVPEQPAADGPALGVSSTSDDDAVLAFVLEVLRLLPPLIALPMFVLAFRGRRRRAP
jgi:Ca-activated chloride channel family protein